MDSKAQKRDEIAKSKGVIENIGRRIKITNPNDYRSGEIATIVGWIINPSDMRPRYVIRFDNGECNFIPIGQLFLESGYRFCPQKNNRTIKR